MARLLVPAERKRRAHAKSRKGCANCRLRRVKCDETQPQCRKCRAYGVDCDYSCASAHAVLGIASEGCFQISASPPIQRLSTSRRPYQRLQPQSCTQTARTHIRRHDTTKPFTEPSTSTSLASLPGCREPLPNITIPHFGIHTLLTPHSYTPYELSLFQRFQSRTVESVGSRGGDSVDLYRKNISPLAFEYPFFMHILLCVTLYHDAYLAGCGTEDAGPDSTSTRDRNEDLDHHRKFQPPGSNHALVKSLTHTAIRHWATSAHLFNNFLSQPVLHPTARDVLWATAVLIGTMVFAYTEPARSTWPLAPSTPTSLSWIRLSEEKTAIWKIAMPGRPDSRFRGIVPEGHDYLSLPAFANAEAGPGQFPLRLRRMFGVGVRSEDEGENPYYNPLLILFNIHSVPRDAEHATHFLPFLAHMRAGLRERIEAKDTRALLLVAWWLLVSEESVSWWVRKRARVTGEGVRIFLEGVLAKGMEEVWRRMRVGSDWWEVQGLEGLLAG